MNNTVSDDSILVKNEKRGLESLNPAYFVTTVLREMDLLVRFGLDKVTKIVRNSPLTSVVKKVWKEGVSYTAQNPDSISFEAY